MMSEILFVDKSEKSKQIQSSLKDLQSLITYIIEDPKTVDFVLPILFTSFGSFTGNRIEDYKKLLELSRRIAQS